MKRMPVREYVTSFRKPYHFVWGIDFEVKDVLQKYVPDAKEYVGYLYVRLSPHNDYIATLEGRRRKSALTFMCNFLPSLSMSINSRFLETTTPGLNAVYCEILRTFIRIADNYCDSTGGNYTNRWTETQIGAAAWMSAEAIVNDWFFRGGRG